MANNLKQINQVNYNYKINSPVKLSNKTMTISTELINFPK